MEDAGKGQEEEATLEGERNYSINEIFAQKSQTSLFFFFFQNSSNSSGE